MTNIIWVNNFQGKLLTSSFISSFSLVLCKECTKLLANALGCFTQIFYWNQCEVFQMKEFTTRMNMWLKWSRHSVATNWCFPKSEFDWLQNHLQFFCLGLSRISQIQIKVSDNDMIYLYSPRQLFQLYLSSTVRNYYQLMPVYLHWPRGEFEI